MQVRGEHPGHEQKSKTSLKERIRGLGARKLVMFALLGLPVMAGLGYVAHYLWGPIGFLILGVPFVQAPFSRAVDWVTKFYGGRVLRPIVARRLLTMGVVALFVFGIIGDRIPQTLIVIGSAYFLGVVIALPIGIYSAYRQYSIFDQLGTMFAMIGFSVPTFFTGTLFIIIFAVGLGWFPTKYDTTLDVTDWESFLKQLRQMAMPVMVLGLANAASISRYMRSSMLENMGQDYVRTARAKGMSERTVVLKHVLRNSLIPVVTVIALGIPSIFGGAIITENLFGVNGIGSALIQAIHGNDLPMVQTLAFIFAILIVTFNLVADLLYGMLDPRIRYD